MTHTNNLAHNLGLLGKHAWEYNLGKRMPATHPGSIMSLHVYTEQSSVSPHSFRGDNWTDMAGQAVRRLQEPDLSVIPTTTDPAPIEHNDLARNLDLLTEHLDGFRLTCYNYAHESQSHPPPGVAKDVAVITYGPVDKDIGVRRRTDFVGDDPDTVVKQAVKKLIETGIIPL